MPTGLGYLPDLQRIVYNGNPVEVRLGTRDAADLKRLFRTRGPPHPALALAVGVQVEDESDAGGRLYRSAARMLKEGRAAEGAAAMAQAAKLLAAEENAEHALQTQRAAQAQLRLKMAEAASRGVLDLSFEGLTSVPVAELAAVAPALTSIDLKENQLVSLDPSSSSDQKANERNGAEPYLLACKKLSFLSGTSHSIVRPLCAIVVAKQNLAHTHLPILASTRKKKKKWCIRARLAVSRCSECQSAAGAAPEQLAAMPTPEAAPERESPRRDVLRRAARDRRRGSHRIIRRRPRYMAAHATHGDRARRKLTQPELVSEPHANTAACAVRIVPPRRVVPVDEPALSRCSG